MAATFKEVQDRINNDYLNRGTFIEETKTAIRAAIRAYENRRWTFNETAVALATTAAIGFVEFPDNLILIDQVRLTVDSVDYDLVRRDRAWILATNATRSQGQPTDFATFQNRLNFSAIPDTEYALPIQYIKRLEVLDNDNDTNGFLDGVFQDVICYHAAKIVWGVALRNPEEASKFAALEQMALLNVTEHFEQFTHGQLKPTSF